MIQSCVVEQVGEEDDATEVNGEPITTGSVRYPETRRHVRGELGGWMGIYRFNEASSISINIFYEFFWDKVRVWGVIFCNL